MAASDDVPAARLHELHARLVGDGDPAAREQIACELWPPLCRRLRRRFPRAPADLIVDAATDAVVAYLRRPQAFDLSRRPLDVFVYGIAVRILLNKLRERRRRELGEKSWWPLAGHDHYWTDAVGGLAGIAEPT